MAQTVNRSVGKSRFAVRRRELALERLDYTTLESLQNSAVAEAALLLAVKNETVSVTRQLNYHVPESRMHRQGTVEIVRPSGESCLREGRCRSNIVSQVRRCEGRTLPVS